MKNNTPTALKLAAKFAELLKRDLTPEQMIEVVKRNNTDEYNGCCATHDFCDANVYMDEALESFTGKVDVDVNDVEQIFLFNNAWAIARDNDFFVGRETEEYFVEDHSGREGHYTTTFDTLLTDEELHDEDEEFTDWLLYNDVGDTYTEKYNMTITRIK